jgi:hypothetical protein
MITLDGVMQAPGGPKEDTSGGFNMVAGQLHILTKFLARFLQKESATCGLSFGQKTFDIWAAYWPQHGNFWPGINEGTKYVFSKN